PGSSLSAVTRLSCVASAAVLILRWIGRLERMMNPTNQQHLELQPLVDDINGILERHGVTEGVTRQDLTITDTSVSDVGKPTPKLSIAITDKLWPSITSARVYHYTSSDAAEKILNSGVFR